MKTPLLMSAFPRPFANFWASHCVGFVLLVFSATAVGAAFEEEIIEVCVQEEVYTAANEMPCTLPYHVGMEYLFVQPGGGHTFTDGADLGWGSAIKLEFGYYFDLGRDVTANFTYFDFDSKHTVSADAFFPGVGAQEQKIRDYHYNLNLEFGRTAYLGERTTMRGHIGAHYGQIRRSFDQGFFDHARPPAERQQLDKFQGFGPRFGFDATYALFPWLELTGNVAVAALVGHSSAKHRFTEGSYTVGAERKVTPQADARLGGQLVFPSEWVNGELILNAGYQWTGYFNAMPQTAGIPIPPIPHMPELPDRLDRVVGKNNYIYHGLYAGLHWKGDLG